MKLCTLAEILFWSKSVMVWIAVGNKGQDLALNYTLVFLYFWLNCFHLGMPAGRQLLCHTNCASISSLSIKTDDIKSGTRIKMVLFLVSSIWQVSRGSGLNGLTMSLPE